MPDKETVQPVSSVKDAASLFEKVLKRNEGTAYDKLVATGNYYLLVPKSGAFCIASKSDFGLPSRENADLANSIMEFFDRPVYSTIVKLPQPAELRALTKNSKKVSKCVVNHIVTYHLGEGLPYVDAALLLDLVKVFSPTDYVVVDTAKGERSVVHFSKESLVGILMPVKVLKYTY